jgi:hypothetical protein
MPIIDRYANECLDYWHLFPIIGMTFAEDETSDFLLDTKLFPKIFLKRSTKLQSVDLNNQLFKHFFDEADAFLGVRMRLSELGNSPGSLGESHNINQTKAKAELAGALITLITGFKNDFNSAAALAGKITTRFENNIAIADDGRSFHFVSESKGIIDYKNTNRTIDTTDLSANAINAQWGSVITLMDDSSHAHESCKTAVTNALIHLATGLYTNSSNEIVANAIACFDLLLKDQSGVRDIQVQCRLKSLIHCSRTKIRTAYSPRNNWLHDGVNASKESAINAVKMAIKAIVLFATLVNSSSPQTPRTQLAHRLQDTNFPNA